jgi:hypothetical protein
MGFGKKLGIGHVRVGREDIGKKKKGAPEDKHEFGDPVHVEGKFSALVFQKGVKPHSMTYQVGEKEKVAGALLVGGPEGGKKIEEELPHDDQKQGQEAWKASSHEAIVMILTGLCQ